MPRPVVFVNRYFHPDHSATSQLLSDLAFHLAARGWDVTVITSRQRYDDPAARLPRRETILGVRVRRAFSTTFGRGNLLGRAVDYASFYAGAFVALLGAVRRGSIVVAKTDPPLISVVAAIVTRLRGASLVNWVQDLFPEVAEAAEMRLASITRAPRNWSLRIAAVNVAISDGMASRIRAARARAVVQHNWADAAIVPVPPEQNALLEAWHAGPFVVEYSGNLGRAHDETTLAATARALGGEVSFVFIGGGSGMRSLGRQLNGVPGVQFLDYQPRERLSESLSAGAVHLVTLRPEFESLILPSKIYGVLAAGRPIVFLGSPHGDSAQLLRAHDCGLVVEAANADALARAILQLRDDHALRERLSRNALRAHQEYFSSPVALAQWERILEGVNA
jgi:colanic acid biosynthesis glycosyl transferase WcaI